MIRADDRGFTLGDGLFETILAVEGSLRLWDAHMERLQRGCATLGLPAPDERRCAAVAKEALEDAGLSSGRAAVRLTWTAGPGGRGLDRPEQPTPALVVTAAPAPQAGTPIRLHTVGIRRNGTSPVSRLKTLSYLDSVLARREAIAAGADEALMLGTDGAVASAAAGNLFWLSGDRLYTPALSSGVLDGVMRGLLMQRAAAAGHRVEEVVSPPSALLEADAIFVTNSLVGVRSVAALDGRRFVPHASAGALSQLVSDAS